MRYKTAIAASISVIAIAALPFVSMNAVAQSNTTEPSSTELLSKLKQGGYVLFMRHPETSKDEKDQDLLKLDDCKTQRNLDDRGRETSRKIGAAIKHLNLNVGVVQTSQFCRAKEAASLMGFQNSIENANLNLVYKDTKNILPPVEAERRTSEVRRLFSQKPKSGTNTLLVSHRPNCEDAAREKDPTGHGFGNLGEGEIAIFRPADAPGQFDYVGRITLNQWSQWVQSSS